MLEKWEKLVENVFFLVHFKEYNQTPENIF